MKLAVPGRAAEAKAVMTNNTAKIGARPNDIAIAACYSAFDLAAAHKGNPIEGIEFARTALDVIERGILAGETPQ